MKTFLEATKHSPIVGEFHCACALCCTSRKPSWHHSSLLCSLLNHPHRKQKPVALIAGVCCTGDMPSPLAALQLFSVNAQRRHGSYFFLKKIGHTLTSMPSMYAVAFMSQNCWLRSCLVEKFKIPNLSYRKEILHA